MCVPSPRSASTASTRVLPRRSARGRRAPVLDVRQRRGVRGREYAWANSARLQAALAEAGIGYGHHPELAPTTELRQLQYAEDDRRGRRQALPPRAAPEYRAATRARSSTAPTSTPLVAALPADGPRRCSASSATRGLPPLADRRAPGRQARPVGASSVSVNDEGRPFGRPSRRAICVVDQPPGCVTLLTFNV